MNLMDVLARLGGPQWDRQLAAGRSPDRGGPRAARARYLVRPQTRAQLAADWENLLAEADQPAGLIDFRVRLPRLRLQQAEPEIRALAAALRAAGPMPVRGVAAAQVLLTDGAGPVFGHSSADALLAALREVRAQLNTARPLVLAGSPG